MDEIILMKLGELVLKGLNRRSFEDKLIANAQRRLKHCGSFKVYSKQSTMYVEPKDDSCDMDAAWEAMKRLFGVVGLSRARACAKDKDAMLETAKTYLHEKLSTARTFKVEAKRADKTFPMTSIELAQYVGGELHDAFPNLSVDVHNPELTVHLEVRDYAAFVHADPEPGAGGLPVGIGGRAVSLLSGGIDSPVASWMMAKRGLALDMVHFFSYPYTSPEAKDKVIELARLITPWCGRLTVHVVPFTKIQEELRRSCPRGAVHHPHAPLHDAHRLPGGLPGGRWRSGHRREPGPGGQPDNVRHAYDRRCVRPAHPPARGGHGQGGDRPHRPEDRYL